MKLAFGDPVLMRVAGRAGTASWEVAPVSTFIAPPLAAALA